MGLFSELRNECLIRELQRELNTDVLLFGVDGHTYFGNLQAIDDCRIGILTAATKASSNDVEILTAGGELFTEATFLNIDLWTIVAKGTGIKNNPINPPAMALQRAEEVPERQESHELIRRLCRMIGDSVAITTLGGFLFEGILSNVDGELAILAVNDIFVPGTSDSISDNDVRAVVINLEALTSVSSTN